MLEDSGWNADTRENENDGIASRWRVTNVGEPRVRGMTDIENACAALCGRVGRTPMLLDAATAALRSRASVWGVIATNTGVQSHEWMLCVTGATP